MQSATKMSRKADHSDIPSLGKIPVKGQRSKVMQGQPFMKNTPKDSVNGVTSPQRKSGRKYETFVMTGDKIIRTTSELNDSEIIAPIKNKEPPVDSTSKAAEAVAKKKKVDHPKSKIPKPSSVNSPKVLPKNAVPKSSPVISPKQSPKITPKVIHSPKTPNKFSPQHKVSVAEISPQTSPKLKLKGSPVTSPKHVSGIPQKITKVPIKEHIEQSITTSVESEKIVQQHEQPVSTLVHENNTINRENNSTENYEKTDNCSNASVSENIQSVTIHQNIQSASIHENIQNKVLGEPNHIEDRIQKTAKNKSHLPIASYKNKQDYSPSEPIPFGYNNQAFIKQLMTEKSSPFDDVQKSVYHTCAAMPIELDIPPDDICSDDERYNNMDDEIDIEDLPPPPAELLLDYDEKLLDSCYDDSEVSYFVPLHNHVYERDGPTAVVSGLQQIPPSPYAYEQNTEQSHSGSAINYSSPVQPSIGTEMNGVMNSVHSVYGNENGAKFHNIAGSTLKDIDVTANDSCKVTKDINTTDICNNSSEGSKELDISHTETAIGTTALNPDNNIQVTSNVIASLQHTSTEDNKDSINFSHIPSIINGSVTTDSVGIHSFKEQSKDQSLAELPKVEKEQQHGNNKINENEVDLHNSDINTVIHEEIITDVSTKNMPTQHLVQQTVNELDIHEDFLDHVLESQTPMDMSFNVPTPPSEKDHQHLISNTVNSLVSKNLPSNNPTANSVSKVDYLNEAATKLQQRDVNSDYNVDLDILDNKESLANIDHEPKRGMVTSISGENFGYKTLPSKSGQSQGIASRDTHTGRNQSPALVRNSKSHENYLDDKDMTMIDIDFGDNIASSVDALHYDQSCTSLDNLNGYSHITEQSKSLDNSPERRYEKYNERIHMPTFFSIEEPRSITKLKEGMKVKESPKRESINKCLPTHETFIPEEPSPSFNIKSEGSSPSHDFFPKGENLSIAEKVVAAEKTKKHKLKKHKSGSSGEKYSKNISHSADNSPAHVSKTKLLSKDHRSYTTEDYSYSEWNGRVKENMSPSHSDDFKSKNMKEIPIVPHTVQVSPKRNGTFDANANLNNNDNDLSRSGIPIQNLSSEPRSPRHSLQEASQQLSSQSVHSESQMPSYFCVQNQENKPHTYSNVISATKDSVTPKNKKHSPGKKQKSQQKQQQHHTSSAHYSPSKHKRHTTDLRKDNHPLSPSKHSPNNNEQQYLGNFEPENDVPPPPYSLVEESVLSSSEQQHHPYILVESPPRHISPGESPTKQVPPIICSPQKESSHKLDAPHIEPVASGSGPSSPDSDTGSIYHQPLKDVDLPSAQRLAKRLFELEGFKKKDISKHLSKKNDFAQQVGEEFLKYFNFSNEGLDASLRKFLKHITLAGETQERERVLVHFSKRYMECNPESFNSEDAAHTLTCALLLLNTDLHGQNVSQKMSLGEFIENLSDLNDGENFPKEVLKSMYHSIKTEALEWEFDEGSEGLTQDFDLIQPTIQRTMPPENQKYLGHNPFLDVPDPNKATEYKKGYVMRKCCIDPDGRKTAVGKRGWKMFYGVLKDMVLYLYKDEHAFKKTIHYDNMSNAIRVHHGLATKATDYKKKQHVLRLQTADSAEYLFQTSNPDECQSWIDSFNLVAAMYSAPPLPGAVGSQKKFQRPLLPASYTRFNMREQYQHHEQKVIQVDRELAEHRKYPPEKGTKSRIIQDYIEKEQYLQFEMTRYESYIGVRPSQIQIEKISNTSSPWREQSKDESYMPQKKQYNKLSTALKRFKTYCYQLQSKIAAYPELEPSLVETAICEVTEPSSPSNEHKTSETSHSSSSTKSPKRTDKSKAASPKERDRKSRSSVGRSQSDRVIHQRKHKSLPESVLIRYRFPFDNRENIGTPV